MGGSSGEADITIDAELEELAREYLQALADAPASPSFAPLGSGRILLAMTTGQCLCRGLRNMDD
jgi:hypothetical protein